MSKPGSIRLITESAAAHGVHEEITEHKRLVLCTVKSVHVSEYYLAHNSGYRPELVFELTLAEDYHGESRLEYEGKGYDIIRAYETDTGGIEITAQRGDVNADSDNENDNAF